MVSKRSSRKGREKQNRIQGIMSKQATLLTTVYICLRLKVNISNLDGRCYSGLKNVSFPTVLP